MVFKTDKHGIRTGNTLKRWNTKYHRNYLRHSYLIRSHITNQPNDDVYNQFATSSALGEGDAMQDGVEYSLNKQGRWEIPEIIEGKILSQDHVDGYGIELVERHRINKSSNCLSICSVSGLYEDGKIDQDRRALYNNFGGYFNPQSVLENGQKKKKKPRRRRRAQESENSENEVEVKTENKLRYEVLYPVPKASYLCHANKAIGMSTENTRNGTHAKHQRCTKNQNLGRQIKESLYYMDESFGDSDEEIFETDPYSEENNATETGEINYDVALEELLLHANSANKLVCNKGDRSLRGSMSSVSLTEMPSAKGRVVYIESSGENEDKEQDESVVNESAARKETKKVNATVLEPVRVILADDTVKLNVLASSYKKYYIECECFPRKFILDISDRVNKLDCFKSIGHLSTTALLVFVHDIDNEIKNQRENVYKVYLNALMNGNVPGIKIETVFNYAETNIDELIEKSLFFIETLPEDSLIFNLKSNKPNHVVEASTQRTSLSKDAYKPDNDFLLEYFTSRTQGILEEVELGYEVVSHFDSAINGASENVASPKDRLCCICYTTIEDSNTGTALIACSHWFCDPCWQEYIRTKMNDNVLDLRCPEFDCNNLVDPGTILSLANIGDVIKHAGYRHDTDVAKQSFTRWCPNEKCGRVIQLNNRHTKTCKCSCGLKICFDCSEPPHWPASCESAQKYFTMLRENGDITIGAPPTNTINVYGKPCPSCYRFIEKNEGCPYMYCVCGVGFCWGCGNVWNTRGHGPKCYKLGIINKHGTTLKQVSNVVSPSELASLDRQPWYKTALKHRVNQQFEKIRTLKTSSQPLARKIQRHMFNAENNGIPIVLNFDISGKRFDRTWNKAQYLVRNTIELYKELNSVIEHIAVLLYAERIQQKHRRLLKSMMQRLVCLLDGIDDIFNKHGALSNKAIFDQITDIRFHSEKTIQSIVRLVRSISRS